MHRRVFPVFVALALSAAPAFAQTTSRDDKPEPFPKPAPNTPDEPLAKKLSLTRGAAFLDAVSVNWTNNRKCATCHTNVAFLIARPLIKESPSTAMADVRAFFAKRVANWDGQDDGDKPKNDTEVVVTAVALAINDARTTGKLQPPTRKALDKMWSLQREDGSWDWEKCAWPPLEYDDYYGAVFAALGVGLAPEKYAETEKAKAGLEKVRKYLEKNAAPNLHHRALLLWASLQVDGLMTAADREKTVKDLLAAQKADGGWSLPSLGDWKGFDGRPNNQNAPSDGYGTGFVIYILRQAGTPAKDKAVQSGIDWLKKNQRESGRWFTPSLNTDRLHYVSHVGSSFAMMALEVCDVKEE
jgi:squalene-hopene/tetraprenyl-beta-curcumene cyclase